MPFCTYTCLCGLCVVCQTCWPWWRSKSCGSLSSHQINNPRCYRQVDLTSITFSFKPAVEVMQPSCAHSLSCTRTSMGTKFVNGIKQEVEFIRWSGAHLTDVVAEEKFVRPSVWLSDWCGKCLSVSELPFYRSSTKGGVGLPQIEGASVKDGTTQKHKHPAKVLPSVWFSESLMSVYLMCLL